MLIKYCGTLIYATWCNRKHRVRLLNFNCEQRMASSKAQKPYEFDKHTSPGLTKSKSMNASGRPSLEAPFHSHSGYYTVCSTCNSHHSHQTLTLLPFLSLHIYHFSQSRRAHHGGLKCWSGRFKSYAPDHKIVQPWMNLNGSKHNGLSQHIQYPDTSDSSCHDRRAASFLLYWNDTLITELD